MSRPDSPPRAGRRFIGIYLWLALAACCLTLFALRPELFQPERIQSFFSDNQEEGLLVYFILATLRGFVLVPMTTLLFAGILVFPPLPLFLVTQLGIYTSSTIVYLLTRALRFDQFFSERYPEQVAYLSRLLAKRELPVILMWGFIPVLPTDLIVSVCSVLRVPLWKTLLGVSVGEGFIYATYIFGGSAGLEVLEEVLEEAALE